MKYFTFGIICAVICINQIKSEITWMKFIDECQIETGASDEEVKDIVKLVPKTREASCFLACVKKHAGLMDDKNKPNIDQVKDSLVSIKNTKPDIYQKFIQIHEECNNDLPDEEDECDAAKIFAECIVPKKNIISPIFLYLTL